MTAEAKQPPRETACSLDPAAESVFNHGPCAAFFVEAHAARRNFRGVALAPKPASKPGVGDRTMIKNDAHVLPDAGARPRFLPASFVFYGLAIAGSIAWSELDPAIPSLFDSAPWSARRVIAACVAAVVLALVVVELSRVAQARIPRVRELARLFRSMSGPISTAGAFWVAALSALGEEAFFRGCVQPRLGLAAASVLFGAVHFLGLRYVGWTLFAVAMGFALGELAEYSTGCLAAPVLCHFLINFLNFRRLGRMPMGGAGHEPEPPRTPTGMNTDTEA